MTTPFVKYSVKDPSHIEDLLLRFLRGVLVIPLLQGHSYHPDKEVSSLVVDVAENVTQKNDNACPAVLLALGDTTYEEMAIDHAAQYTDPEAAALKDAAGKIDPVYNGASKRTLLMATTPVTIEVVAYDRRPCMQFASRIAKVMFVFSANLHRNTDAFTSGQMRVSRPQPKAVISGTAYASVLSFSILHIAVEDVPEVKNIIHQFFMKISTIDRAGEPVQEINMVIDTKEEV